ncbi:NlpC/P60 family protein [Streptomyces showdoensis]|uniref:NlpC/P60 family protein n=1 Tax=Streptomyces showdoensis TaxID=68268 RepID=UPI000F4FACB7|nr:NlpC/P60 family protein [Streptomyces showdoensis]
MSTPKSSPSRRATLLAFAGVAAGGALPLAATAPAAAAPVPTADPPLVPSPLPGLPDPRRPLHTDPTDAWHFAPHPAGPLTTRAIAGGLEVSDGAGVLATLTTGARTVTVRGPKRWFTEQKQPVLDDFGRVPPKGGWGMSPGGGGWSHINGADADYTVEGGQAVITFTAADSSRFSLLPDYAIGDVNVRARFSFDKRPVGANVSLGLVFGAEDVNNHYRARLVLTPAGEVQLVLEKELADQASTLGAAVTVGTGYAAGEQWWVRVERTGDLIRARAWKDATEPAAWTHTVTDASFPVGAVGVRGLAHKNATVPLRARVDAFRIETAIWPDPPLVTHDTWVRVLPEPFAGAWTTALEQRITAWAGDTSPDALAYCAMYQPYAPAVTRDGRQVLGTSEYSKADPATGLRTVGADFQEYLGIPWSFPVFGERDPEPEFFRCLDCSGFVRMVFGYHLGLPMLHESADAGSSGLARTSSKLAVAAPGVKIAESAVGETPPLDGLRIGDTVYFDTDTTTDEPGGHVGIYLGPDAYGKRRFVSSRKSPNGPTLGDVGGKSILDGRPNVVENGKIVKKGDVYTVTLRVIRRF